MAKIVVCVDDSATVLMTAQIALEDLISKGVVELKTFDNPLNALQDIKNGLVYDLLITDINMPQMNGFDFAAKLKQTSSVRAKPIIALTTENSPNMKMQGKKVGLVGWITKPFTNDKLVMGIKRILRIR
jgi:two-component system chemotaxis response regulator CheY